MGDIKDIQDIKELLGGLEKYGFDEDALRNAFNTTMKQKGEIRIDKEEIVISTLEEDFLLLKSVVCPICDNVFSTMVVKSGKARRIEPDFDLRPRFEGIDVNKYEVTSCRKCGYTALNKEFSHLTPGQMKMIEEGVCKNYKIVNEVISDHAMDYDTAIERYKLALYTSIIKRAHVSEKAYECLKIAWLYRGKIEWLIREANNEDILQLTANIEFCKKEELKFYSRAYDGLIEARATESFPICGMDANTYELLIAAIAYNLDRLDEASNLVTGILQSRTSNKGIKNRALKLKEMILKRMNDNK